MKNIFLFILTFSSLEINGQKHLFGFKSGVNLTNITSRNFLKNSDNRKSLNVGFNYEYLLKKHFSIGFDLIYNKLGFANDIIFTDNLGNPTGEKYTTKYNYDYISFPLKTGFNIGTKFCGFTNVGIIPSFLINAKTISPTFDQDINLSGYETFKVTNYVSKFNFSGLFEIGGRFTINDRYLFFTSMSYFQSFTSITNSNYFSSSKIRHHGFSLNIGLKYSINN